MSILIKNGRILTAVDDYYADLLIEGEKIKQIGVDLQAEGADVIDASGMWVLPGGIDPHTHLDMPSGETRSSDDFETGTLAAAFGGTTTLIDFATQSKGHSTLEALDTWHRKAAGRACIDYSFHMIVTDMPQSRLSELDRLRDEGVSSYKLFMAYPGVLYVDDGVLYRTFRRAGENGSRIAMHAENGIVIDEIVQAAVKDGKLDPSWHGRTRPTRMEAEAVHRSISIAEVAEVPLYIVHLSSADALEEVKRGRARGVDVMAETCPQYLLLDRQLYDPNRYQDPFEGAKWVMTPALRERSDQEALWQGLRFNDVHTIGTDHCPFSFEGQKELGRGNFTKIPNGAPGIENRMSLIHDAAVVKRGMSPNRFVDITSTAAAKAFGLFPKKGTLAVGSDADVLIFDPDAKMTLSVHTEATHHMNVDYCAFEGREVQGCTITVLSRGRVVIRNRKQETHGGGEFIKRVGVNELLR